MEGVAFVRLVGTKIGNNHWDLSGRVVGVPESVVDGIRIRLDILQGNQVVPGALGIPAVAIAGTAAHSAVQSLGAGDAVTFQALIRMHLPTILDHVSDTATGYKAVKDRFIEILCKRCGSTRDGKSWTKTDLATMARQVGFGASYSGLGYFPTLQLHTTAQGIATRLEAVEGGTVFKQEAQRDLADDALVGAHLCLTVMLEEQIKHFSLRADISRLRPNYLECLEEYQNERRA